MYSNYLPCSFSSLTHLAKRLQEKIMRDPNGWVVLSEFLVTRQPCLNFYGIQMLGRFVLYLIFRERSG
jgi:hypothetical protein